MQIRSRAALRRAALVVAWLAVPAAGAPTFHDLAPLLWNKCAPCHRPAGPAPFALLTYADAAKRAQLIATVTRRRYIPPWLPQPGYGTFAGDLRLTDADITALAEDWQLGTPDLVLEAPAAYTVPASGPDVYWNFVFTAVLPAPRYVRAVEIRPGNRRLVHHANLLVDRLASFPPAGFAGMDVTILRSPFDLDGHFLFWKPGGLPHVEPDGWSWRLNPGNQLLLNTHLHPSGRAEEVRPSLGLYFTDKPPTEFPLLVQLENDAALDIPPGAADFAVADRFRLPMPVEVIAIYPHAHYLGKVCEAYATLPGGGRRWLIRIPDWDSNWQAVYYYREPVRLPRGAVITMRWIYDNSAANPRNPHHPPRRVRAGNQADDEMAHLWLELKPEGAGDRRRELQEAVMQHRLDKNPQDFEANFNLAASLLSRLDAQGAVSKLRAAIQAQPARPDAHDMLGSALTMTGRNAEAIAEYETVLRLRSDYPGAHFQLANALVKAGRLEDAIRNYRAAAEADPANEAVKQRLAEAQRMLEQRR